VNRRQPDAPTGPRVATDPRPRAEPASVVDQMPTIHAYASDITKPNALTESSDAAWL
jgi:hypothetical protein